MFKENDEDSRNALDARTILGPDWQEKVKNPQTTCL